MQEKKYDKHIFDGDIRHPISFKKVLGYAALWESVASKEIDLSDLQREVEKVILSATEKWQSDKSFYATTNICWYDTPTVKIVTIRGHEACIYFEIFGVS